MKRSVPIEIGGMPFFLCYTVKATREIEERYGSLEKMADKLRDKDSTTGELLSEILWLLHCLLRGGYDHEKALSVIAGKECAAKEPPEAETLEMLYAATDVTGLQEQIFLAIRGGGETTVKIEDEPKNADATPEQ